MSIEQFQVFALFILVVFISAVVAYFMHRRRFRFPFYKVIFSALLIGYSVVKFFEGNIIAVLFAWFSAIMAVSVILDILVFLERKLNEKLALTLMLIVISGGGVLTNIFIFSSSVGLLIKVFVLAVLIAIHIPFLIAVIARLRGRRKLSGKIIRSFYLGKDSF